MPIALADDGIPVNENTNNTAGGGSTTDKYLMPQDQYGDPIGNCQIVVYKKSEWDAGSRIEKGTTFTRRDGRWCQPIYLPAADAQANYYAVYYRPARAKYSPETGRCFAGGFGGITVVPFVVPAS